MLQNPLTPPYEDSTATSYDTDNAVQTATESVAESPLANAMISTPMSNISRHETPGMDGENPNDSNDEDQDMADGGAILTTAHAHSEQHDTGLVHLQPELYGVEDHMNGVEAEQLYGLDSGSTSPSFTTPTTVHIESISEDMSYNNQENSSDILDVIMEVDPPPAAQESPSLPTALSAVSLQLQHLQDGLDHAEVDMATDDQDGSFANTSNQSLPLFSTSPFASLAVPSASLATGASSHMDVSAAVGIQSLLHSENPGHMTVSNVTMSPPISEDAVPFVDIADNVSDADQDDVEDHYNLSLGEFLYNWARSGAHSDQQRKRKVPQLSSVIKQRELRPLVPVRRSDLQGELCDIQRINWAELGVSRREARQMRMRLYNNYRNVRPQHHHHHHPSVGLFKYLCSEFVG
jgi:hypothetical protein